MSTQVNQAGRTDTWWWLDALAEISVAWTHRRRGRSVFGRIVLRVSGSATVLRGVWRCIRRVRGLVLARLTRGRSFEVPSRCVGCVARLQVMLLLRNLRGMRSRRAGIVRG